MNYGLLSKYKGNGFQDNENHYIIVLFKEPEERSHNSFIYILFHQERKFVYVFQCDSGSSCYCLQWIFSDMKRNRYFIA